MLKKIFPAGVGNAPYNSFKLILVAEGYLAAESAKFAGDCVELIEALLETTPFNLTRARPNWLSVYASFDKSDNAGPAIDAPANARSRFDASLNSATQVLTLGQAKINAYVNAETVPTDGAPTPLSGAVAKGQRTYGRTGTLICVLLPPVAGHPTGGEGENAPGATDFHYVATTKDGLWHQVVARALGNVMGLGDEFELPGNEFLQPDTAQFAPPMNFNLQYFSSGPPNPLDGQTKWLPLIPLALRGSAPSIHPNPDPTAVDTTVVVPPVGRDGIEFWEGGGGYRTKVWRASRDCLMRRRIADASRPVRTGRVPFCAPCREALRNAIW